MTIAEHELVSTVDLPKLPLERECPYRPASGYGELRRQGVTKVQLHDGQWAWLITGYEEARAVLRDSRVSSNRLHPSFPWPWRDAARSLWKLRDEGKAPVLTAGNTLLGADPPVHTRQRRLLTPFFSVKRLDSMRPLIARVVDDKLGAMIRTGSPADLLSGFALPVSSTVICELLGVPYSAHRFFEEQARLRLDTERGADALTQLWGYLDGLISTKEVEPGRGLIDDLIAQRAQGEKIERSEIVAFSMLMLIAGHDSTANSITLGALALIEHPDQLARLRSGQASLPHAVEELLRYMSIVDFTPRVATADIEIGGQVIQAGEGLIVANGAANHDGGHAERSSDLDVSRAPHHLAFGFGIHQCLGQNLARVELEIALRSLFGRLPDLRLAVPRERLTLKPGPLAGVNELPVAW